MVLGYAMVIQPIRMRSMFMTDAKFFQVTKAAMGGRRVKSLMKEEMAKEI